MKRNGMKWNEINIPFLRVSNPTQKSPKGTGHIRIRPGDADVSDRSGVRRPPPPSSPLCVPHKYLYSAGSYKSVINKT